LVDTVSLKKVVLEECGLPWHPIAGTPPILQSTHAFSIDLDGGHQTDDFAPKIVNLRGGLGALADWVRPASGPPRDDVWTAFGPQPDHARPGTWLHARHRAASDRAELQACFNELDLVTW